ncbi:TRAP transporter permease [Mameliella alba]|uniref:C4-dicarboxylate ABC transporter n=1 Tax=Mameliella alba TaxID=561184 RepID=A0A0B3SM65_9RHOB|nr:TRAP transporter permease [Mameliella alba]KHQ51614.1 C4-dicarboxylate ABC transporter [Mameliella alba]MBY6120304.1 TRAP transporter permease [Mameliella alba]ODM45230.1 C4-dicarboxylate ABC transporter [Ruegeria sp. PBVC088]OWV40906.1 C4-dicarboxylate ABC transporter [Mameliella alba]
MSDIEEQAARFEAGPRKLDAIPRLVVRVLAATLTLLAVNQTFNLGFFIDYTIVDLRFYYMVIALGLFCTFLLYPASQKHRRENPPWHDWVLAVAVLVVCGYFIGNTMSILLRGWEMSPPPTAIYFALALWALVLEAGRRAAGWPLAIVVGVMSFYPIYTEYLPAAIAGFASPLSYTAAYHAMGSESILGIPMRTFANLIIGFLIFGAALQRTGAGAFFMDLSFALLGRVRGGPAKVSIFSSGLMGSMSGSVITNVLTTGVMTIPAMKRIGIRGTFAAGVETCASTGGTLMPPVMGATAFVMASIMNVPYANIALAAIIPSALYFFGLFVQIDSMAAKENLSGMKEEDLPKLGKTIKEGWYYIFAFAVLIYMLLVLRREALAPYYATPLLILLNQVFSKKHRWTWSAFGQFLDDLGSLFANLVAILAAVGLIIGALSMTGVAATLVNDLLRIADGNSLLLLIMGALTGLILGIGMTSTAAYIFLAILLAPALIRVGLDPIAVHMFIFYWGMLSFITPPVALGAFAAASIAKTPPMKTGFEAMRLGSVIYFIPFFFVFDPALVGQGTAGEIASSLALAVVGIALFACAMQGYVPVVGALFRKAWYGLPLRIVLLLAAILIALPADGIPGWNDLELLLAALVLAVPVLGLAAVMNRNAARGTT